MIYFKNINFKTGDFSPLIKWLLAGVTKFFTTYNSSVTSGDCKKHETNCNVVFAIENIIKLIVCIRKYGKSHLYISYIWIWGKTGGKKCWLLGKNVQWSHTVTPNWTNGNHFLCDICSSFYWNLRVHKESTSKVWKTKYLCCVK